VGAVVVRAHHVVLWHTATSHVCTRMDAWHCLLHMSMHALLCATA
jgi:hypothetical protein